MDGLQTAAPVLDARTQKEPRNVGVELLRVVSMMMVVMIHILGHGGVYVNAEALGVNYQIAWYLEVCGYCAVDCYALISGFANIKSNFKWRRLLMLWLEVVTLNAFFTVLAALIPAYAANAAHAINTDNWLRVFFPLAKKEYWYFNAYVLMFPFLPILNQGILSLGKKRHLAVMLSLLALATGFRLVTGTDQFALGGGYSCLWLMILYVVGAYFRLYGAPKWAKPFVTLPAFFLSAFVAWEWKLRAERQFATGLLEKDSVFYENREYLISYLSPCMVVMAIALLLFFMQIRVERKGARTVITALGKASFGVFVLHVGSAFWDFSWFWWKFASFASMPPVKMTLAVLGATAALYLSLSLISLARIWLFAWIGRLVDRVPQKEK